MLPKMLAFQGTSGLSAADFKATMKVKRKSLSRVRLCDPMDYTVREILQARILEWLAFPFSKGIFPA